LEKSDGMSFRSGNLKGCKEHIALHGQKSSQRFSVFSPRSKEPVICVFPKGGDLQRACVHELRVAHR